MSITKSETFGRWLRDEMGARGWDQTELSLRGKITQAQLSRVLSGSRGAGLGFFAGIARAFGVPSSDVAVQRWVLKQVVARLCYGPDGMTLEFNPLGQPR